jgi:23S rRNA pseudouridine1911/1915/1917 synthase
MESRSLVASSAVAGLRLDVALTRLAPDLSRSRVQRLMELGRVLVDGRPAKAAVRLRGGERVDLTLPDPEPTALSPQDLPLQVLFEDRDLLVLDKAAGMVVHPARGTPHSTVVNALLHRLGTRPEHSRVVPPAPPAPEGGEGWGGGGARVGLVHRLDKDTSGCLVVAKTVSALEALQASFKAREVEKQYLAICHGRLAPQGRLDTPYGRHRRDRTRFTTRVESPRRAVTSWRVREIFAAAAVAEVTLHTGRTHQIRVHLAESGHPMLADAVYGGTRREARLPATDPVRLAAEAIGRQALHAWRLAFPHPRTGRRLALEAPVPADFERALRILRQPSTRSLPPS